jgi:hypothetical protein
MSIDFLSRHWGTPHRTGFAYAAAGQRAKALKIAEEISKPKGGTPYNIACIYAALGENDRAFEHLEIAYYARYSVPRKLDR